jgi:toxin YoeB
MRIELDEAAFEDLAHWVRHDGKKALRILKLIREAARRPFDGTGKPEPLRSALAGYGSRRVDSEHRLVYRPKEGRLRILSCRYHYE